MPLSNRGLFLFLKSTHMYKIKVWDRETKRLVKELDASERELASTMGHLREVYPDRFVIKLYEVHLKEVFWRFEDELSNNKKDNL